MTDLYLYNDAEGIAFGAGHQQFLREAACWLCGLFARLLLETEERDLGRVLGLLNVETDGDEDLVEPLDGHELGVAQTEQRDHEEEQARRLQMLVVELQHFASAYRVRHAI